jgi:peroxiredoxin
MPWLRFLRLAPLLGLIAHPALAGGAADTRYMPECRLQALGPSSAPNLADYRGKVLYVDFWASWCGHCGPAFRFLNALEAEFRDAGFAVVGINVDERADAALAFLEKHPARFAVAADPRGACPAAFSVNAMPSSFLVDRNGVVRRVHVGFREEGAAARREEVRRLIESGLAGEDR